MHTSFDNLNKVAHVGADRDVPKVFYHFSCDNIDQFHGLTHFGTAQAANDRMQGAYGSSPGGRIYPCVLDIQNPLVVQDTGDLDIVFDRETLRSAGVDQKTLKWVYEHQKPGVLEALTSHYSFFSMLGLSKSSIPDFEQEISEHGIFSLDDTKIQKIKEADEQDRCRRARFSDESAHIWRADRYEIELRKRLITQRSIIALEKLGFDGLVYTNREEDYGSTSYCIFRPEQAVNAFEYAWSEEQPMPKPEVRFRYPISAIYDPEEYGHT